MMCSKGTFDPEHVCYHMLVVVICYLLYGDVGNG